MEDETLNNVLNLLQNASSNNSNNTNNTNHNNNSDNLINNLFSSNTDLQTLLIKFLLSGGLNQILNFKHQNTKQPETETKPEKLRTIDLTNYQRLD